MKKISDRSKEGLRSLDDHLHVRNVFLDIFITLITCFLFNIYIQYRQILAVNDMIGEERYSFIKWLIFCILTFGLYHIYHEFVIGEEIGRMVGETNSGLVCLLLTFFGLGIISDAIQQNQINSFYGEKGP
jgi:hypothetical protein